MPSSRTPARRRPAAVKINTPPRKKDPKLTDFELGGVTYQARMPKDFVWIQLFAATASDATTVQKSQAFSLFLQACLDENQREQIKTRMSKPPEQDPVRGLELLAKIKELIEGWEEPMKAEFDTALDLSGLGQQ